jgi:hypothetical protein
VNQFIPTDFYGSFGHNNTSTKNTPLEKFPSLAKSFEALKQKSKIAFGAKGMII